MPTVAVKDVPTLAIISLADRSAFVSAFSSSEGVVITTLFPPIICTSSPTLSAMFAVVTRAASFANTSTTPSLRMRASLAEMSISVSTFSVADAAVDPKCPPVVSTVSSWAISAMSVVMTETSFTALTTKASLASMTASGAAKPTDCSVRKLTASA